MNTLTTVDKFIAEQVRHLNESTYILRFSRGGMDFKPGQHIKLGVKGFWSAQGVFDLQQP